MMKPRKSVRTWTPFLLASALSVLTAHILLAYSEWAQALLWLLLILNIVLLVTVIVRASSPRRGTVALGVAILIATQWWFVLTVLTQVIWSIRGFAP